MDRRRRVNINFDAVLEKVYSRNCKSPGIIGVGPEEARQVTLH